MAKDETGRKDMENLSETLKQYAKDREIFQEEAERFRSRYEEYERRLSEYKILAEEAVMYEQQLVDYRNKRRAVMKAREQLWERTRLCIQCGTAYLGPYWKDDCAPDVWISTCSSEIDRFEVFSGQHCSSPIERNT